jgi:D-amino-acid dehydrogenase
MVDHAAGKAGVASTSDSRIVVVGGGIVGLSAAYYLARRGAAVTLVEQDSLGVGASAGNAGIVALGHPPLPHPGLVAQLARLLFVRTHPVYIAPRLDPALPGWLWGFLRACNQRHYQRSLAFLAELGWAAGSCFRELVEQERIDCEYNPRGWLEIFRTPAALRHGREVADTLRGFNYRVDELSGDELRAREPAYRDEVHGALHYTDSAFANPGRLVTGLAEVVARMGADLLAASKVNRIRVRDGRFTGVELEDGRVVEGGQLVLAAGSWTTGLARSIGIRVPMQAGKGYHVNLGGIPVLPSTTCVLAETLVAVTPLDGGLRLAGTVELSGLNLRVAPHRLEHLRRGARDYIRAIDDARIESTWCGLRPLTADGLPVIGWAPGVGGVFVATGHAMMGFLLGPLSGRLVAESLLDGAPSLEIGPLRADRF